MYPKEILPGIDLYLICMCLAVMAAIIVYRIIADKIKIEAKLQNLCIFTAVGAIIFGYFSAVLFQAFYNIKENGGEFIINSQTGATFYGGLIGGAAFFLLIYFLVGNKILPEEEHKTRFFDVADSAACSIAIAHAIGRIGCLFAGCCHGKRTEAWFGIFMQDLGYKVIPTQLLEALFLIFLFVYLFLRVKDKQTYCLQIYMCAYGAWRFVVEYLRDDYRGSTFVDFVTPSQLIAIAMIAGGALLILLQRRIQRNDTSAGTVTVISDNKGAETESEDEEEEYDYDYGESSGKSEDKSE
ncbi:MAG: prolipoprotein diacylglyceryl transferase [Clostridia bacterium]|nr:prolipoprotein diacylglyceryl transferase [Clostridia bacterium]